MKNVLEKYQNQTHFCKICFKPIKQKSLYTLLNNGLICDDCLSRFSPKFRKFKVDDVKALTLFDYDVFMRELIYKFKGCFDFELGSIFIEAYKREIRKLFDGYTIVPAPSYKEDDNTRGFNHVVEIFRPLGLEIVEAFEKTEKFKQADHNFKGRQQISKYIKLKKDVKLRDKVLLVDDIYTTGSTMKAMIFLMKSFNLKSLRVLVLCKTTSIEN